MAGTFTLPGDMFEGDDEIAEMFERSAVDLVRLRSLRMSSQLTLEILARLCLRPTRRAFAVVKVSGRCSALRTDPPDEAMRLGRCYNAPYGEPIDRSPGHDHSTFRRRGTQESRDAGT